MYNVLRDTEYIIIVVVIVLGHSVMYTYGSCVWIVLVFTVGTYCELQCNPNDSKSVLNVYTH